MVVAQLDPRVRTLLDAVAQRHEIERIDPNGELSEADAYALQFQQIDYRVEQGDSVVGLKTGLTSVAKQQTMGVHQPIFGHIMASSVVPESEPVACAELIHPRAEPVRLGLAENVVGRGQILDRQTERFEHGYLIRHATAWVLAQ